MLYKIKRVNDERTSKKVANEKLAGKSGIKEAEKNSKLKYRREYTEELLQIVNRIASDKNLLDEFLQDILSPAEYKEVTLRWQIVKRLHKGVPHQEVAENLRVAIGTVTRGSRALLNNNGGFSKVLRSQTKT